MSNWERNDPPGGGSGGARTEQDPERVAPTVSAPSAPLSAAAERPQPSTRGGGRESAPRTETPRARKPVAGIVAALVVGLLLGAAGATFLRPTSSGFAGAVDETRYQAVILSNDKVYFGRISSASGDFYELKNAFFLRETRASDGAEPVRALLPVNREIHAPDNDMLIRKQEVVLVENLAKDSPILQEIQRQKG